MKVNKAKEKPKSTTQGSVILRIAFIKFGTIVASSVQVAPERILLVGENPQAPRIIPALRDGCAFCENA